MWKLEQQLLPSTIESKFLKSLSGIGTRLNPCGYQHQHLHYAKRYITYSGVKLWISHIPTGIKQATSFKDSILFYSLSIAIRVTFMALKTNFANSIITFSFVIINESFCSSVLSSKHLVLYSCNLSSLYSGRFVIKRRSSSMPILHIKHFLSFRSIFGLKCLLFSLIRFDNLNLLRAMFWFTLFIFVRYFSR